MTPAEKEDALGRELYVKTYKDAAASGKRWDEGRISLERRRHYINKAVAAQSPAKRKKSTFPYPKRPSDGYRW